MIAALVLGAALQRAPQDEPRADLTAVLAEAVDLRTPAERRAAADRLAKRGDATLDEWLTVMRTFGCRGEATPGSRIETVELFVDGAVEPTELWIHVPASYDPRHAAPLMMAFHGTGGEGSYAGRTWERLAEDLGMLVLAPSEAGENKGFAATVRERESPLAALRWMRREFNVDEDQVYASGFSRGGHLTWDLALRYPDQFAAIAPMAGGPRWEPARGAANLRYVENLKPLSIRGLIGAQDQEGLVWNVRLAFEKLAELGARDAVLHEDPDLGHDVNMGAVHWLSFLAGARRDPEPEEVVRLFAREGEGRAFWVEVLEGGKDVEEVFTPRVRSSRYAKMSEEEKRLLVVEEGEKHTGRVSVKYVRPGRFEARTEGVGRFRLLLSAERIGEKGQVEVKVGNRRQKRTVEPDAEVLLREFVERFDRTFLPVAEVVLTGER